MIEPVLKTIMGGGVDVSRIMAARRKLLWSVAFYSDEPDLKNVLTILLDYIPHRKRIPPDVEALREFISIVPGGEDGITPEMRARYKKQSELYRDAVYALEELVADDGQPASTDFDLVVMAFLDSARKRLHSSNYTIAAQIINGSFATGNPKEPPLSGIVDAKRFLQKAVLQDAFLDIATVQGDLHQNLDLVRQTMLNSLGDSDQHRCYTGFGAIDSTVVIGPGEEHRFIGILGYTNDGKTGLLMTTLYNMLRQGKRIMFVPLEFSPMEAWMRLVWLHMQYADKLNVPSLKAWKTNPRAVTPEHIHNFNRLIDDLKNGKTLPGRIEVVHAQTWPEIVDAVNASPVPYDVLAIDYIAHLRYEGRAEKREAISNIFRDAQLLSRSYRENRGLVVITPVQANKEGVKNADEPGEGDPAWGIYNLGSVDTYTDAARDLDLLIGVWQRGTLKRENQTKVSCVKSRGEFFPVFITQADRRTWYFRDLGICEAVTNYQKPAAKGRKAKVDRFHTSAASVQVRQPSASELQQEALDGSIPY